MHFRGLHTYRLEKSNQATNAMCGLTRLPLFARPIDDQVYITRPRLYCEHRFLVRTLCDVGSLELMYISMQSLQVVWPPSWSNLD